VHCRRRRPPRLTTSSSPADAELVLPEAERPRHGTLIPSVVRYDEQVLAAASRIHRPSGERTHTRAVPGMARRFGEPRWYRLEEFTVPVRRSVRRPEPVTVAGGRTAVGYRSEDLRTGARV
jgi:hypothetical protein